MLELCDGVSYDDEVNEVKLNGIVSDKEKSKIKKFNVSTVNESKSLLVSETVVGLDTLAAVSIFRDDGNIIDKRKTDGILVSGVNKNGKNIFVNQKGISTLGLEVYVSKECAGNILSLGDARDNCHSVEYQSDIDIFKVQVYKCGKVYIFSRDKDNLYTCDIESDYCTVPLLVETVVDRMKLYSKREIRDAVKARELQRQLGFMRGGELEKMISNGKLRNCEVSKKDVRRAESIFGQDIAEIKGKATSKKGEAVKEDDTDTVSKQLRNQTAHADLFFVNGRPFLITVFEGTEYSMVLRLPSKTIADVLSGIRRHVAEIRKQGFEVVLMRIDGESAVGSEEIKIAIAEMKIDIDIMAAGEAVPVVERKIRVIKERVRAAINSLPFELCDKVEDYLVLWAVSRVNLAVTSNSTTYESPREKVYGRRVDVSKDCKHGFGDYVQIINNTVNNSMSERSRGAIALMPTGNLDGSWWYFCLDTCKPVRRRTARALPMPQEVIDRLNELAKHRKRKTKMPKFRYEWSGEDDDIDDYEELNEEELDDSQHNNDRQEELLREPAIGGDIDMGIDSDEDGPDLTVTENFVAEEDEDDVSPVEQVFEDINNMEQIVNSVEDVVDPPRYNDMRLRSNRAKPGRWSNVALSNVIMYYDLLKPSRRVNRKRLVFKSKLSKNMSVDRAIEKVGDDAIDAVVKEMIMIIDEKQAFESINIDQLTEKERKQIIPSKLFLKEKFLADGTFEKLKARLVAGGHMQSRDIYDDGSSPTVGTSSVFMCACIAAHEGRSVSVIDFPGAYLNSKIPEGNPPVYMRLNKFLTMVMCAVDDNHRSYVNKDGTSLVRLTRALYGTIDASKIWYDNLTGKLKEMGYTANPHDMCVLNKTMRDGSQATIVIHVDDLMLTCKNDGNMELALKEIEAKFGEVTIHRGKVLNYLGMVFDFSETGRVRVTMDGFVQEMLSDIEVRFPGECETPAKKDLFVVGDSKVVETKEKEFFHTYTAKLLYLAKRVRPDILVAVSYLTKRVQCPNDEDINKLERVIKYIRHTKDKGIVLEGSKTLQVEAYVDASHGIHEDFRGHTGSTISIGFGPVYSKSGGQKINTKSSAESELVGLSDSTGQIVWTRNFLISQGYDIGPATIYQDNQSTMALIKNGKSSNERTRHIAIRFFFVSDRVSSNEIKLQYMDTEHMLADVLTKPLQGELFRRLRDQLLNWYV